MRSNASSKSASPALLPSVDEMLARETVASLISELGRERVVAMVRDVIAKMRSEILDGGSSVGPEDREAVVSKLTEELAALGDAERLAGVRRVINATGVVIHTNLGRAPLSDRAVAAMRDASGYSAIEYDVAKGSRGARGPKAISLVKLLTGAEDAIVVNNCAAAALLVLSVFAQGREVIVSRGELVEIGGDFRIPDILARSGAILREVGTTNRTHLRDYENAVSDRTAMILKVHPSNFRITGFTKTPGTPELVDLARKNSLIFYEDAGSGALIDLSAAGLTGEPVLRDVIDAGADLVSFSGDKLLGGPQAGIVAGRAEYVERLRRDPFCRALRLDKIITAALEATLEAYARGSAEQEIPVLQMLALSEKRIAARAEGFAQGLRRALGKQTSLQVKLCEGRSAVGGGAAPDAVLNTALIALTHPELTDSQLEQQLRSGTPPIITRIETGQVLIDLRTVTVSEEHEMIDALAARFSGPTG
jgi:L-seryl-tRNA(Ser) seleniumtransferase